MKKPSLPIAALIGLSGAATVLVSPGLFLVPGLFGYLLLAGGATAYAVAVLVCGAGAYALGGWSGVLVLALILPVSLALYLQLRRRAAYFDTAMLCAGMTAAYYYLLFALPDLLAGNPAFTGIQTVANEFYEVAQQLFAQRPYTDMQGIPELLASFRVALRALPAMMPGVICLMSALSGLFCVLVCYALAWHAHAPINRMRPFAVWQLPKSFGIGVLVLAAGVLIVTLLEFPGAQAVTLAVMMVAGVPFAVQGIALIWFVINLRKRNGGMIVLFILMMLFALVTFMITMAFVGVFEQLLQIRKRFLARPRDDQ